MHKHHSEMIYGAGRASRDKHKKMLFYALFKAGLKQTL